MIYTGPACNVRFSSNLTSVLHEIFFSSLGLLLPPIRLELTDEAGILTDKDANGHGKKGLPESLTRDSHSSSMCAA